jgi:hypothetical protein
MSSMKDAILDELDARDQEARDAEYAARGQRTKRQTLDYDAFEYCYDHNILPVPPAPCSRADLERIAAEHLRDSLIAFAPLGEDLTIFGADQ